MRASRRALLFLPLAIAACGFTPVYAPGGNASALRGKVEVSAPNSVDTYMLVRNIEERLGRPANPEYRLSLRLTLGTEGQAVTAANETTRYSLVGRARYKLTDLGGKKVLAQGTVDNFTNYSAAQSTVETLASERDARKRLMVILADQITTELYSLAELGQ